MHLSTPVSWSESGQTRVVLTALLALGPPIEVVTLKNIVLGDANNKSKKKTVGPLANASLAVRSGRSPKARGD